MSGYLAAKGVDPTATRSAYKELADLNKKYGEIATDTGLAAAGALPPPFGTAADVASLGRSLWKGDWGGALMDAVGIIPIVGDAAKAGKIANKLNDLRKSMDVAATTLGKSLQNTKAAAKKYWADMVKANKADYDKAIKNCKTKACRDSKAALKGPQYGYTPTDGPNGKWKGERGDSVWEPSNGGPAIKYKNGFPDYGPHSKGDVEIAMRGNETSDFTAARNAMRERTGDPNWTTPKDMTWHHKEDGVTMQLIPKSVHATGGGASTPHMGGASLYSGSNATEF
ncbi:MAG: HNH endonuclease [Rhodobacteraceae bacterium]|jgi:A nuclease of the HNH/ENDO VII superfamily with conserved WHH|nr:HNH endonuclease [Paracoccaceae bacterium]